MKTEFLHELDPELREKLRWLKDAPPRDARQKALRRSQYLAQLKQMPTRQPSVGLLAYWPFSIFSPGRKTLQPPSQAKWGWSLGKAFATISLALLLVFGSIGVTTYAAQNSLPSSAIYPVKLLSEDIRLELTTNAQTKFDLILAYANKRVEEIAALQTQGVAVGEPVVARLQDQYEIALQIASDMPDAQMAESLEQLQETAQIQLATMSSLKEIVPAQNGQQLERVQKVLEEQQMVVQNGLKDPMTFRDTIRNKYKHSAGGNNNGIGSRDEPDPGEVAMDEEPRIPSDEKGPSHDQKEPSPPSDPPGGDNEKGNGPGSTGEEQPGEGSGSEGPEENNDDVFLSNYKGFNAQYGSMPSSDQRSGQKSKFNGSPIFVP